jgi:hypothetical protein
MHARRFLPPLRLTLARRSDVAFGHPLAARNWGGMQRPCRGAIAVVTDGQPHRIQTHRL